MMDYAQLVPELAGRGPRTTQPIAAALRRVEFGHQRYFEKGHGFV